MKLLLVLLFSAGILLAQSEDLERLNFLIGNWKGNGEGFGKSKSVISASYSSTMNDKFIEVVNESHFEPTEKNPDGEHHIDRGFISFDNARGKIVYRQFNIEGYVNQYLLNESLSNQNTFVFETENIENFVPGGKARYTIKKLSDTSLETIFDVSFPGKEYACFGTNRLTKLK